MSIASAVERGRILAESLMQDTCTITRKTGEVVSGGVITPTYVQIYTGNCRIQARRVESQGSNVGEAYRLIERLELQLPVTVTGLAEGDVVTVTASALDPDLLGRVFAIRGVTAKTHLTYRRAELIEVTS